MIPLLSKFIYIKKVLAAKGWFLSINHHNFTPAIFIVQKMTDQDIHLHFASFSKIDNNIIIIHYKANVDDFTIEDAYQHTLALQEITGGTPSLLLLDYSDSTMLYTPEAREYFASDCSHLKLVKAKALVVKTTSNKLIAKFYISFNKPGVPVKSFNGISTATDWLLSFN